jgi:hypothetical protein
LGFLKKISYWSKKIGGKIKMNDIKTPLPNKNKNDMMDDYDPQKEKIEMIIQELDIESKFKFKKS